MFPDYDTLRKAGTHPVLATEFVFLSWDLQNPMPGATFLLHDRFDPTGPREPYFQHATSSATLASRITGAPYRAQDLVHHGPGV